MENQNIPQLIIYKTPQGDTRIEVTIQGDSIWLTQRQIADLFGVQRQAITKHLKNIFDTGELNRQETSSILELVQQEGNRAVKREREYYNLDVVISVYKNN